MGRRLSRTVTQFWGEAIEKYKKDLEEENAKDEGEHSMVMVLQEKREDAEELVSNIVAKYIGPEYRKYLSVEHLGRQGDEIRVDPKGTLANLTYPPLSTIKQAILFVVVACKKVPGRLNEWASFSAKVGYFLERLALIESRLPEDHASAEPLIRVFITVLNMCGTARKCAREGKTITFSKSLVGKDDELADHLEDLTDRVNDLESGVVMATVEKKKNLNLVFQHIFNFLEKFTGEREMPEIGFSKDQESSQATLFNRRTSLPIASERDYGTHNSETFRQMLNQLSRGTEISLEQWSDQLEKRRLEGTCVWIENTLSELLLEWEDMNTRRLVHVPGFIHISGNRGTGKSMLAYHAYCYLKNVNESKPPGQYVVLYFSFSVETGKTWSVEDMLSHFILQIAAEDELRRAKIQEWLARCGSELNLLELFKYSFSDPKDNLKGLFMIIDGPDDLDLSDVITATSILPTFIISIPRLGRHQAQGYEVKTIPLGGKTLKNDLSLFATSCIEALPKLREFPAFVKETMAEEVCDKADSYFFIDHILRWLDEDREVTPGGLVGTDQVFELLLKECFDGRTPRELLQIHCLFVWLIYTKTHMSMHAMVILMNTISDWDIPSELQRTHGCNTKPTIDFGIRGELGTRLERLLGTSYVSTAVSSNILRRDEDVDGDLGFDPMFGFSTPSLQNYYQTKYMPTFPYTGEFLMLKMAVSILTMKDKDAVNGEVPKRTYGRVNAEKELITHASNSWSECITRMNLDSGMNPRNPREDVVRLVTKVMCNENGALRRLEEQICLKDPLRLSILDYTILLALGIARPRISIVGARDADSRYFVYHLSEGRVAYSVYIARKHVQSWWTAETPLDAYRSFRFARQAVSEAFKWLVYYPRLYDKEMLLSSLGVDAEADDISSLEDFSSLEDIHKDERHQIKLLSEALGDWHSSCGEDCRGNSRKECRRATQLRCRAMALRFNSHYTEALDDINGALSCQKSEHGEEWKFELLYFKGRIHLGPSEDAQNYWNDWKAHKDALTAFQKALGVVPENTQEQYAAKMLSIHQMIAKTAATLDRSNICLKSVDKITKDGPDGQLQLIGYFEDIVAATAEYSFPTLVNKLLAKVPKQQLAAGCTPKTYEMLHYDAEKENETDRTRLDNMYAESVKVLEDRSMPMAANSRRVWWAIFKRKVKRDLPAAKNILQDVLRSDKDEVNTQTITFASWQLGGILLEEFYGPGAANESAGDMLARREEIYGRMEQVVRVVAGLIPDFQAELSQTSILLVLMEVGMGSLKAAQRRADAIFEACYKAVTDDVASNDSIGFQMLAKILAVVPALMGEAKVAASYQFYIADEQRHRKESLRLDDPCTDDPLLLLQQPKIHLYLADDAHTHCATEGEKIAQKKEDRDYKEFWPVKCGGCRGFLSPDPKVYLCYYCVNTTLCGACHRGIDSPCQPFHKYVEIPFLMVGGETKETRVLSKEEISELEMWLKELKGKWNRAWIDFIQIGA